MSSLRFEDVVLTPGSLLVYRRARRVTKDSVEETRVEISLSYYEIYNDKVFDLFEPPEKRSLAGLPLRDNGDKAVVVGLTERSCESLKDFEMIYDQGNSNRSTSATKVRSLFKKRDNGTAENTIAERGIFAVTRYTRNKACNSDRRSDQKQYCICH